ncbi:MFS transporter [Gordonia sp. VNK21]|uniref:MFS transporter n=1 Tax=Gordonia sp. VNK21 TaxID=3382483 RepID=UPI0038D441D3
MRFIGSLRHSPGLWRLLAVRLTSQISDGAFQSALAFSILFNPDRHTDPLAVAGGFAVLLLPYSVIGPFAGALLDHWDRRRVLVWVNVLRALAVIGVAATMHFGAPDTAVLLSALLVTGCSRFVASGLSAGLPHVAAREVIVETNALFTTLGAGMLAAGAGISTLLRAIFGSDNDGSGSTLLAGAAIALVSALIAAGFATRALGPDQPDDAGRSALYAVGHGLGHGARVAARTRTVAVVLAALGVHRFVFGVNTLMLLIVVRQVDLGWLGDEVRALAAIGVCIAAGALAAAFAAPLLVRTVGRRTTITVSLIAALGGQLCLMELTPVTVVISGVVLGLAGQTIKLCGDAAMQLDVSDTYRGQVFAVQDALFNVTFVVAIVIAALSVPADGVSVTLVAVGALLYAVAAAGVWLCHPAHAARVPVTVGAVEQAG